MQGEGDFYSVAEAERLLGRTDKPISERRIRQMLQAGDLEGRKEQTGRWHVAQHEVHRLMQERRQVVPESTPGGPENAPEMLERVFMLEREIGRLQGRLELEERAESTVREERDRLLQDLEEERAERRRLQERLEERERPWWRRVFGG
jgi:vacuolar-type H+-ATPase subunit I/STV1